MPFRDDLDGNHAQSKTEIGTNLQIVLQAVEYGEVVSRRNAVHLDVFGAGWVFGEFDGRRLLSRLGVCLLL